MSNANSSAVRAWANARGIQVGRRGPVNKTVLAQYMQENAAPVA